ncbi:MAG: hypothetical protein IGBAC_1780 [Ignavibacteriae bacterium]|nr:MAG: hypothetical protein IGBAC_1780 [Ignavibacteriota bacterium]
MVHRSLRILKFSSMCLGCPNIMGNPFVFLIFLYGVLNFGLTLNITISQTIYSSIRIDSITNNPDNILLSKDGFIYLLSSSDNLFVKFNPDGSVNKMIGGKGWGNLNFDNPTSFYSPDDLNFYITDCYNNRIQRFNRNLEYLGSLSYDEIKIKYPYLIGVDKFYNVIVYDLETKRFFKYTNDKKLERTFGELELSSSGLPFKILFDSKNNIITSDRKRILIYSNWGFLLKELKFDIDITNFTLYDNDLFVLSGTDLNHCDTNGKLLNHFKLSSIIPDITQYKIVDLVYHNRNIYILSSKFILKIKMEDILNWKEN